MARTTATQVKQIIEVDTGIIASDADLDPFIDVANELVTEMCTGDNGPDTDYTSSRLELIERWLTAHFYAVRDPRSRNEKVDVLSVSYEGKTGLGLDHTRYGQQVKMLDTNGGLARMDYANKKGGARGASLTYIGTKNPNT